MRNRNIHTVNGKTYSKVSKYVPKHKYNIQVGFGHVSSKGTYSIETNATKKALLAYDIFSRNDIPKEAKKPLFKNIHNIITN